MDAIISTFHIDWKIIIAQAFNFGVVFVVLYVFALKPLSKLMADRQNTIVKGLDDAKTNAAMLTRTEEEYNQALQRAKAEANEIFQSGKKDAQKEKTRMVEEAKAEVSVLVANGKKTLEAEKAKMMEEAKKEIVALAMKATEKLIKEKEETFNEKAVKELNQL